MHMILAIVNNPTTAFFMMGRFNQLLEEQKNVEICFLREIRGDDASSLMHWDEKRSSEDKVIENILKGQRLLYAKPIKYYLTGILDILLDINNIYHHGKLNSIYINKYLISNNIDITRIDELWTGNCFWTGHIKSLSMSIKIIKFDHGITETFQYLRNLGCVKRIKNIIFKKIKLTAYKYLPAIRGSNYCDEHYSINYSEINRALGARVVLPIYSKYLLSLNITLDPPKIIHTQFKDKYAIILLDNIKPWTTDLVETLKFFSAFEKYLIQNFLEIFNKHKISRIFFKSKLWHSDYTKDGLSLFSNLKKFIPCEIFEDVYGDFPIECYLVNSQIELLAGNLSSGLFFSKKINESISTYSYDEWFSDYTNREFGGVYPDIEIIRELVLVKYFKYFNHLIPKKVQ